MEQVAPNILTTSLVVLVFITVAGVLMLLGNYVRMKKQRRYFEDLHQKLAPGQRVIFSNGLYGKVKRAGVDTCDLELKGGQVIEVSRFAIQQIVTKNNT